MSASTTRERVLVEFSATAPEMVPSAVALVTGVSDQQIAEIQAILIRTTTVEDGYRVLGEAVGPGAIGANALEAGRQFFTRQSSRIASAICGSPVLRGYCTRRSVIDATTAATLVAAVLLQHQMGSLNIPALSCLAVRIGLSELCLAEWSKP